MQKYLRAARKTVQKTVYARQGQEFIKHVVPAVVKPARTLWNEFIAFLFFCFAGIFGFKAGHLAIAYSKAAPEEELGSLVRLIIAGFCTVVMIGFGFGSLLRARRIARS